MTQRNVSRKQQLKQPDEFISFTARIFAAVVEKWRQIATVAAVILVVLAGIATFQYFSERSETAAFERLEALKSAYATAFQAGGKVEDYEKVKGALNAFLEEYGGRDAGRVARVLFANLSARAGDLDQSIRLYEDSLNAYADSPGVKNLIQSGLGHAYEAKGDFASAVKCFESIVNGPEDILKDEALFSLGRLYAKTGNPDKSLEAYRKIDSQYGQSPYAPMARERISG